jgi:hypothetical protein
VHDVAKGSQPSGKVVVIERGFSGKDTRDILDVPWAASDEFVDDEVFHRCKVDRHFL